ncbi:MAG: hypothetical protein L6Q77_10845 [Bacteroidetes bacterium]|nr:hypothetical protein [Bacteroidota bacterium]
MKAKSTLPEKKTEERVILQNLTKHLWGLIGYLKQTGHDSNNKMATVTATLQLAKMQIGEEEPLAGILDKAGLAAKAAVQSFKKIQQVHSFLSPITEELVLNNLVLSLFEEDETGHDLMPKLTVTGEELRVTGDPGMYLAMIVAVRDASTQLNGGNSDLVFNLLKEGGHAVLRMKSGGFSGVATPFSPVQGIEAMETGSVAGFELMTLATLSKFAGGGMEFSVSDPGFFLEIHLPLNQTTL